MSRQHNAIHYVRQTEREVGAKFSEWFAPYRLLSEELVSVGSDILEELPEGEPGPEHAMALIAARVATESLAVHHLLVVGYPVQAFTLVGSMLELMHTAAYIGGDPARAREYFEHADRARAYPGNVKKTIHAVGQEFGLPEDAVIREYDSFYAQMCMVKHGNPMAMSLGTIIDEENVRVLIGPVYTVASIRLGFASAQQAVRYALLSLTAFVRHHRSDTAAGGLYERLKAASARFQEVNVMAAEALTMLEAKEQSSD